MANSLLDFVMSVVRDPDAAAQYAADPAQAIANANLTDVSSVDVNNLIPVVAESLSSAMTSTGADSIGDASGGNVWASGAATAAFDAFDSFDHHLPTQVVDDGAPVMDDSVHNVIHDAGAGGLPPMDFDLPSNVPAIAGADDPSLHVDAPVFDDMPSVDASHVDDWGHTLVDDHQHQVDAGMDLFT